MLKKYITLEVNKDPLSKSDCFKLVDESKVCFWVKRWDSRFTQRIYKHNLNYRIVPEEEYKLLKKYSSL